MIKALGKYVVCLIIILVFYSPSHALMDTAKITIHIIDEAGNPVEGAKVGIGFGENSERHEIPVDGFTDADGKFIASESCNGYIGFNVTKGGYYESVGNYTFKEKGMLRWEPWNPKVSIVLRKIENPVPLYARDTNKSPIEIPLVGKDIGFDLVAFDWVSPYGKGIHADFIFLLTRRFVAWNDQDSTLILKFNNRFDGIQQVNNNFPDSVYSLPRNAYDKGYTDKLELYIKSSHKRYVTDYNTNVKNTDNYFFRIRSEEKDGKLIRSMYGKIVGKLDFSTVNSITSANK